MKYLHIGAGSTILPPPFENLDIRPAPGIDHEQPAYPLTFTDDKFDLVYASHVLEHFNRSECLAVLKEWVRVLKPDGILRLSVPSFENCIRIYQASGKLSNVIGPLMGGQTYEQNYHYNLFDLPTLTAYMQAAGLTAVHPWDYRRTIHSGYFDFSQATTYEIPISLNLEGRKV